MKQVIVFDTTGRGDYPPRALEQLEGLPIELISRRIPDQQALLVECRDADIILMTALRFDRPTMEQLPRLRGIVRYGVGLDTIDLQGASELGVEVRNVRDFCSEEIADHALGMLIACARGLFRDAELVRQGEWRRCGQPVRRLRGSCLGIVGLGAIGRALATRAQAVAMMVLASDPFATPEAAAGIGVSLVELPELLGEADFVSLHCPLTERTRHLLGPDQLALMKPSAYLINTARGGLVDQPALTKALQEGRIAGAALDVLDPEVPAPDDPLRRMDNVILTPHVAWYSEQALEDLVIGAFARVAELVRGMRG